MKAGLRFGLLGLAGLSWFATPTGWAQEPADLRGAKPLPGTNESTVRAGPVSTQAEPGRKPPWDLQALYQSPRMFPTPECPAAGVRAFYYEGMEYKGRPVKVFAYYSPPPGLPAAEGWPAVVCAHGGGGTAFPAWVKQWNGHGYAAIAMDLEGHLPEGKFPNRPGHDAAGPARVMTFMDIELAHREQWFYHAVADVIRANSLLRSFPEINRDQVGVTGISWGGVIVSAVAGLDHRFAFAIPVFGCGFLQETDNEEFGKFFKVMTAKQLADYRQRWDPSVYLPEATLPMLWLNGANDPAFPVGIWQRSALATHGPRTLCLRLGMKHGHSQGWTPEESYAFADSVVKGGLPLPEVGRPEAAGDIVVVRAQSLAKLTKAELCYTLDTGEWKKRAWKSSTATLIAGQAKAPLPSGAKALFFNVTDDRGLMASSELVELPHP